MAGQGRKEFSDGEVLSAADVNGYLMDQSVMRFADSSARTAAIGTPTEGMVTYLDDVNQIEIYDGTAWVDQQAPVLSEGTAGQYLQSNGTAGSQWVTLEIADNIITTEGDLIVGGSDNTPERLPIGAEDTVLTSDGTAVSWSAAGGGGGGEIVYLAPNNTPQQFSDELAVGLPYSFTFASTGFSVALVDADDNVLFEFNTDTIITPETAVARIYLNNETGADTSLSRSNPVLTDGVTLNTQVITTTQSVTLTTPHQAFIIGGGGGGGGLANQGATSGPCGGGGGSGFIASDILAAGTYTATIGAGGAGGIGFNDGAAGGTTSIAAISASGGNGGKHNANNTTGGDGGSGGSGGGGGGASTNSNAASGGAGGTNGADGDNGSSVGGTGGLGGDGSGVQRTGSSTVLKERNYDGGNGGSSATSGSNGADGTFGRGGFGANADRNDTGSFNGGSGGNGLILLVEVV